MEGQKAQSEKYKKNSIEDDQTVAELSLAHRMACQLVQTSYVKQIKLFLFAI